MQPMRISSQECMEAIMFNDLTRFIYAGAMVGVLEIIKDQCPEDVFEKEIGYKVYNASHDLFKTGKHFLKYENDIQLAKECTIELFDLGYPYCDESVVIELLKKYVDLSHYEPKLFINSIPEAFTKAFDKEQPADK